MKTRDWLLVVATLLLAVFADQASKNWAWTMTEHWVGPIHFVLVNNDGAMLGMFSKLPAFLRIVTLSTSGFFILSLYAFLQFMVPVKVMRLRLGLSLLVGGILGNVLDRTYYGYVLDFISMKISNYHTPIWNVADMIQWVGYALLIYSLFKDGKLLWPDQDYRNKFWINKRFQLKYAFIFIGTGVLVSLVCMVFSYTYFKIALKELGVYESHEEYTKAFLYSFGILVLAFSIVLFSVAKFISHRIAGPVYAFERFLSAALDGKGLDEEKKALQLRAGDDFKHLEKLAEKIKARLIEIHKD
ncbi:MAG: signal peptidase II [Pseudobdellovibrio sp.]|nr:signal peptidase II [Pseudobdellovibrio sp.]